MVAKKLNISLLTCLMGVNSFLKIFTQNIESIKLNLTNNFVI